MNPYPVNRAGGVCTAGTSYDQVWILRLDRPEGARYKAKSFIWLFGVHNGCQNEEDPHLPTCTPFTCDGQTVEGEGASETEAVAKLNQAAKKVADTLWE